MMCPLCHQVESTFVLHHKEQDYFQCQNCELIFVPKIHQLSHAEEKKIYDQHQNDSDDPNYRRFLDQLFLPMQERIAKGSPGLDFGSGPGPTLSKMFEEVGHLMSIFDPYYANDKNVLTRLYDFITLTEVAEHLSDPREVFKNLSEILNIGGHLGVMTKLAPALLDFSKWYYKEDPTHITFYSKKSFEWLGDFIQCEIEFMNASVVIFKKVSSSKKFAISHS